MEQVKKSGATWARNRASEARLAVYVISYFPRNMIKIHASRFFLPQSGILNKSILQVVFITMYMNVAKKTYFHLSLKYIFFTFSPIYFLIMFLTWHKILAKKLNKILQLSAVVICDNQYGEFLFFNCTKNSTHLKIMVPGLRGPAGGLCKSEDITGWGLKWWPYRRRISIK